MTEQQNHDSAAANQRKDEPVATSPDESPQASDDTTSDTQPTGNIPAAAAGGVPTPGDSQGVGVPSVQAAAGTSEESGKVEGVTTTSLAAPGKPDGEVDTRS